MNKTGLAFLLCLGVFQLQAQKNWTLEECVSTGLKNNITMQQQGLSKKSAEADLFQSKMNLLPSLNAQVSNNWNIGFAINPVTNASSRDVTFRNNNFGLSASWTLFNGFQNTNNYRLQKNNTEVFEQDLQNTKNTIALQICNAYLSVLLNLEVAESRKLQMEATKMQVAKQEKLYELGASSRTKLLQLRAQLSNEELQVVMADAQLTQAYLSLWQSMNILPDTVNKVQRPDYDASKVNDELRSADQVFSTYLQNSPEIKAAQLRTRSAQISTAIAQGGHSPRLTFSAGVNSFYSTQNQQPTGLGTTMVPFGYDGSGNPSGLYTPVTYFTGVKTVSFSEQFDKNLGKSFGLSLGIPIFNGWAVNNNVQKQKLSQMNAELNEQQVKNNTYKSISQAYVDFKAAMKKYEANVNNLDANKESSTLAETQYSLGAIGLNDYLQTRNAYLQAETNYLQAKYELIFRRKVLDFYLGKPLY